MCYDGMIDIGFVGYDQTNILLIILVVVVVIRLVSVLIIVLIIALIMVTKTAPGGKTLWP